jgi:hypothetical protein
MTVGSFFKGLVPYLAAAAQTFGGPAGAIAASVLTKITNTQVKPADIGSVISQLGMTEEGRIKLDAAEKEYAETMARLGYDSVEKYQEALNADLDSARVREEKVMDKTPRNLAYLTVAVAAGIVFMVLSGRSQAFHDPVESATIGTVIGFVFRDLAHVYAYYFGGGVDTNGTTNGKAAS